MERRYFGRRSVNGRIGSRIDTARGGAENGAAEHLVGDG
jgi:hypothetical protein